MEDLKQIQEFFSKPLNEDTFKVGQKVTYLGHPAVVTATKEYNGRNFVSVSYDKGTGKTSASNILVKSGDVKPLKEGKQLDQVDFAKVVKAVEQTGHPVTVLLVPKFNEIEVLTGMDAPDDMLRDLSDAVDSLGYGRNDIIIAGDSSNLSRREYSDIRRVNGGAKDYFEESVNEAQFTDYSNNELAAYARELSKQRADAASKGQSDLLGGINKEIEAATRELKKRSQKLKGLSRTDVNEQADHVNPMVAKAYKDYIKAKKDSAADVDFAEDPEKAYRYYSKKLNNTYSTRADRDAIEAILKKKYGSALEENKPVANVNRHIKAIQIQLDQLGVKYEMSGNPYKPFKAVYKPINKDDKWYDNFEDIVFRYNLGGVVKTSMDEANKFIKEGKQLDQVDFAKVVKAVEQTGHPVTVLLVPKFNEIEIITGMDAPDDMLRDLSDAVDSLGYGRNDIIIAGDSSNLSRREYSDIRRVNGGAKDYFEESVNENEDPIIVKYFKRGDEFIQILVKYEITVGFTTALGSRTALGQQNDQNEAAAQKRVKTIVNNLKANFDLDDIFVEKGQVTGRYYINAFSDDFIDMDVNDLEGFFTLEESLDEAKEDKKLTYSDFVRMVRDDMMAGAAPDEKPSDEQVKKKAKAYYNDYLQGASVDDLFEATKKEYNALLDKEHELTKVYSKDKTDANWKKLSAIRKKGKKLEKELEDQGLLEASKEEENEFHKKLDKLVHKTFGHSSDEKKEMEEYNTGLDYHPSKEKSSSNSKKSSLKKVKDMIKRAVKEGDITVDDKTEFKLNLKHLLDKHIIQKEDLSDYEETEADYNKLYSNYAYKAVKEVFEEKGFSKYLKSKDNPKGETDGLTPDVLNKILMNVVKDIKETNQLKEGASTEEKRIAMSAIKRIAKYRGVSEDEAKNDLIRAAKELGSLKEAIKEIFETIELGQNLNEELCPKGKAYIKKRQAAGEKSSAYLSGRAVKVCKGQMKG